MRIPISWLTEYVPNDLPLRELADVLTNMGLEVEAIEDAAGAAVFDIKVTPNRGDCLSILGIAREVAAVTGIRLRHPRPRPRESGAPAAREVRVRVEAPDLCPRYCAAIIQNLKIAASPAWLQERLAAAGMRPINSIVDITNYVMLEMGQPLHAFDLKKIRKKKIVVRRAQPGEKLLLLDGSERELSPDMLVIADAEVPVALAGVMGGLESEVDLQTSTILLESANFNPASIRRTSQALKVRTDASNRFEKGLSRELAPIAAQRAVKLMVELCGGRAAQGLLDVCPGRQKDTRITVTQQRLFRVLGVELPTSQVRQVLSSLGFGCRWLPPDRFIVRVPYWRTDVTIADDVIEEVARIMGYDQLPTTLLRGELPPAWPQPARDLREHVRDVLAGAGFQEVITYSLTDLETLGRVLDPEELATNRPLRLANPLSREQEYARTTLRHSLLDALAANVRGRPDLLALFETARVYLPRSDDLPHEVESACGVMCGPQPDRWGQPRGEPAGFYKAKAAVEIILDSLRVPAEFQETVDYAYLPGRTAAVVADGRQVGLVGQVHPRVAASFDIEAEVAMFELDLDALQSCLAGPVHYQPVPLFPSVEQDLAVILDKDVPAARALAIVRSSPLVRSASVFDVYTGPPVPAGKKSLAFSISFQAEDHTLTDDEVGRHRHRIVERLRRELGAEPRG
ncbi:MAG TPA: phenylalanine--tRNA ligase subunit beta [Dehalococcoidia bacterium]|nr:phenylalanine--tRNA ligase subunit beta [Dehalococcoidia bacterium]